MSLCFKYWSPNYYSFEQDFNTIQKKACFTNWFLDQLAFSKTLRYLRLDSYFLLNSKQNELCFLLEKNQFLKILNITIQSSELKQLTEGLKQNVGLEILNISVYFDDSQMLVYQLLHSLHNHPELKTLILTGFAVTDIKPVSRLLLYNSKIDTVDLTFTVNEVFTVNKVTAVSCLVFNGRRTEFDLFLNNNCERNYRETFQKEVDTFKDIVFNSMVKVMSYIIIDTPSKNPATGFGSCCTLFNAKTDVKNNGKQPNNPALSYQIAYLVLTL